MILRTLCLGDLDTNCYVLWDDNRCGFILDPADEADRIIQLVEKEQLNIKAVVLSHAHFDHMLAAQEVCDQLNASLYVGNDDSRALSDPMSNLSGVFGMTPPIRITAQRTLKEGETFTVGALSFTVIETPGHTPGSICLYGEGLLLAGDTLFRDSVGRIDFPGGSGSDMLASLRRLSTLPADTVVYPGHGQSTTIGRETAFNPYMK